MPLNLFVADQIIFWMASIHKHAACVYRRVGSIYLHSSFTLSWRDSLLSYQTPDCSCGWTNALKNGPSSVGHVLLNQPHYVLQTYRISYPSSSRTKSRPSGQKLYFNISLFFWEDWHFVLCLQNVFPRSFSSVDLSGDYCLWLVTGKRVMRFYG